MNNPRFEHHIPTLIEREELNAALLASGTETGFWDEYGRPTPWPADIDQWTPLTSGPDGGEPAEQPF